MFRRTLLLLAAILPSCGYCEVGGGESSASVDAPMPKDGEHVLSEAQGARIVLEQRTRKVGGGGEKSYLLNKTLVEHWLRLKVGDGSEDNTLLLARGDDAMKKPLELQVEGMRVAVLRGDEWRVFYRLGEKAIVADDKKLSALNWSALGKIDDEYARLYRAQIVPRAGKSAFDPRRGELILRWVNDARGEDAAVELMAKEAESWTPAWPHHVRAVLSASAKAKLKAELQARAKNIKGGERAEQLLARLKQLNK